MVDAPRDGLKAILGKIRPEPTHEPLPPLRHYERRALACAVVLGATGVEWAGSVESVTRGPAEAAAVRAYLSERATVARVPVDELTDLYVCIANAMANKTGTRTQRELVDVAFGIEAAATINHGVF